MKFEIIRIFYGFLVKISLLSPEIQNNFIKYFKKLELNCFLRKIVILLGISEIVS